VPTIRRTRRSEDDLLDIWAYIAQDNPDAADRLLDDIERTEALLAENPRLGPARSDIAPEFRYFPIGNYLILYRVIVSGIEIVRVIHGGRRLNGLAL
jgi:toxin ParE1/3/4